MVHRFAFKFLLFMYKHMDKPQFRGSNLDSIRARVRETCKGHLQWVFKAQIGDNGFDANYWVNGRIIKQDGTSWTALPSNSPANMPAQILKACEYLEIFQESADFAHVLKGLGPLVNAWLKLLHKNMNHRAIAWRHASDSVIPTFRLDDHIWIWKALDSNEKLLAKVEHRQISFPTSDLETLWKLKSNLSSTGKHQTDVPAHGPWDYSAAGTRKQILRRFTTEIEISKKRTLGVTRSALETRFLFHSRDTALYYGLDWGFFADGPQTSSELWQNLVECQALHDDGNDEWFWDNPLRYALSLRMGVEGHVMDKNFSPSEMVVHARSVLLASSSANGLFPGQLDATSKAGSLFDHEGYRDFYFHAGFEIPYLLLWAAERETSRKTPVGSMKQHELDDGMAAPDPKLGIKMSEPTVDPTHSQAPERQPKHQITSANIPVTDAPISNKIEQFSSPSDQREKTRKLSIIPERSGQNAGRPTAPSKPFKRRIPFSKFVDLGNIVEMTEEWLYNYPKFLDFKPSCDVKTLREAVDGIDRDVGSVIVEGARISLTNAGLLKSSITGSGLKVEPTSNSTDKTLREAAEGVDRDNGIVIAEEAENSLTKAEPIIDPTTGSDMKSELTNHFDGGTNTIPARLFDDDKETDISARMPSWILVTKEIRDSILACCVLSALTLLLQSPRRRLIDRPYFCSSLRVHRGRSWPRTLSRFSQKSTFSRVFNTDAVSSRKNPWEVECRSKNWETCSLSTSGEASQQIIAASQSPEPRNKIRFFASSAVRR